MTPKPLRVYIAAPLAMASLARSVQQGLEAERLCRVVSRWHHTVRENAADPREPVMRKACLKMNLVDMSNSDVTIALTQWGTPRATFGDIVWNLAHGRPCIWCQSPYGGGLGANIWDANDLVTIVKVDSQLTERIVVAVAPKLRELDGQRVSA